MVTDNVLEPKNMALWKLFLKNRVSYLERNEKELSSIKDTMRLVEITVVSLALVPDKKSSKYGSLIILQV